MNSNIITLIISFFIIVLAQVFLFNNMFIFGFINPMIYLLFLVVYRFDDDQTLFILLSFVLGFCIDFLSQSGGAHTLASLTIGFVRPLLIKYLPPDKTFNTIRFADISLAEKEINWRPIVNLPDGLKILYKWLIKNRNEK